MPFPEMLLLQAWEKAGGQCECRRWSHSHPYVRCTRKLVWENRGRAVESGWVPRYRTSPTSDTPLGCEILCWDCHRHIMASELKN